MRRHSVSHSCIHDSGVAHGSMLRQSIHQERQSMHMEMLTAQKIDLFTPGEGGSKAYRIPALLTTKAGTVIAANDARLVDQRDNPNKINITIKRSLDQGKSWEPLQTVVAYPGNGLNAPAAIDSALLQDQETGTIWMLFSHTPGGLGLWNCGPGIGFDEQGQRLLYDHTKREYVVDAEGVVYTRAGEKTGYTIDAAGGLYSQGLPLGHIYEKFDELREGHLYEAQTCYLQLVRSEDEGDSWSQPIELNVQVKEEWMQFLGAGPGIGIQLQQGKHKGRLVFPVYFSNAVRMMSCAVIYSDDHGQTWRRGESPNDSRLVTVASGSARDLGLGVRKYELTESQVVELAGGTLAMYMRNHYGNGQIARAFSEDGGQTWSRLEFVEELLNPVCQISVLKYPGTETDKEMLLFSGPASESKRENGIIRLSEDGGKTWPYSKVIERGSYVYSCLTVMDNGQVGILYETEQDEEGLIKSVFTTTTLAEIKGNK